MKKYQIIYADPPWNFTGYVKELKGGITRPPLNYNTMKDEEIINLPVKNIVADDAILFLWAVDSRIPIIEKLMKSWGFTYKTVGFVWNKVAKNTNGVNATFSKYTRKSCEFLFIGTRGKCLATNHTQNQYFPEPKGKHSVKPPKIRDNIVNMCGDLPRIELFARVSPVGWDVWGNEVESDISL
jgi:N6-adenosine-specific RNA methylase IME4